MRRARWILGGATAALYILMALITRLDIIPGAGGAWPPDFRAFGYDVETIRPFVASLSETARTTYAVFLTRIDPLFILCFAAWMVLSGWRGGSLRYAVAAAAALYAGLDLSEDAAIHRFVFSAVLDEAIVARASVLTSAKFVTLLAALGLLLVHWRRSRR